MLEITFSNIDKVIEALNAKGEAILSQISRGMTEGMEIFKGHVIKEQMSGRQSASFGLNRVTGTLARSWWVREEGSGENFLTRMGTEVKYAAVHQYGWKGPTKRKDGSPGRMRITPKRLYVLESFYKWGKGTQFMTAAVSKRLSRYIKTDVII